MCIQNKEECRLWRKMKQVKSQDIMEQKSMSPKYILKCFFFFIAGLDRLQYPSIKCSNYLFEPFVFWLLNLTDPTMRSAFICIPQLFKKNDWKKTHFFDTKFCSVFYKCIFFKPILISVFLCLHVSEVKVKHCQKFCSQHCCQWKQHIVIQYEILQSVNF